MNMTTQLEIVIDAKKQNSLRIMIPDLHNLTQ